MKLLRTVIHGTLLLILWGGAADTRAQDPRDALPLLSQSKELNESTPDVLPEGTELLWERHYEHDSATNFIRLHIVARGYPDDVSWFLLIKDGQGNIYDRLTAASFRWKSPAETGQPAHAERWTQRVPGRRITVELRAQTRPRSLRIHLDRLNYSFFRPGKKAVTTRKNSMRDLIDAYERDHRYYAYGRSMAIIYLQLPDGSGRETNCTGFLIAPDLMMTNHHCISEPEQLDTAKAVFGFETRPRQEDTVAFTKIEMKDAPLDFAILRMAQPASRNWPPVKIATGPVRPNQQLILIQHPSEQRKIISEEQCVVQFPSVTDRPQNPHDFYHLCDCEGGSSGAAVLDEATGKVVGLHHLGIERPFDDGTNLAVKIGVIMQKIKSCDPSLYNYINQFTQ